MSKVLKQFTDKETKKKHLVGSEYEGSNSRISELFSKGFLDEPPKEPNHIGGGYYELPNGERVRGKEKAKVMLNDQ